MHQSIDVKKRNGHFASDALTTVFVHEMGFEARSWANGRRAMPFRLTLAIILMPSGRNMPLPSPPPLSLPPLSADTVFRAFPSARRRRRRRRRRNRCRRLLSNQSGSLARSGRSTVRARSSLWSIGPVSIDARRADRPTASMATGERARHARAHTVYFTLSAVMQ